MDDTHVEQPVPDGATFTRSRRTEAHEMAQRVRSALRALDLNPEEMNVRPRFQRNDSWCVTSDPMPARFSNAVTRALEPEAETPSDPRAAGNQLNKVLGRLIGDDAPMMVLDRSNMFGKLRHLFLNMNEAALIAAAIEQRIAS